jgi:hypothetical protein
LSALNALLVQLQLGRPIQYHIYTDRGYTDDTHIRAAYHGNRIITPIENWHNMVMSSVRVSVEWMFAKIKATTSIVSDTKTMKVGYGYIAHHVTSAVLLSNAHSCLRGNQTCSIFNVLPPSVEEYFTFV